MKINLHNYGNELRYWIAAFKPFVDQGSKPALDRLGDLLEDGRERHQPRFAWKLDKPIWSIVADRYDSPTKTPDGVQIGWKFESSFLKEAGPKNRYGWTIDEMVTQIEIRLAADHTEILKFHYDMKTPNQLGPHSHMQFSEHFQTARGRVPIGVPRFPSAVMLPTDCLDLVLSEFFPLSWPKEQSGVTGLAHLRAAQEKRLLEMSRALVDQWKKSPRMTPIARTQSCYMPQIQIA